MVSVTANRVLGRFNLTTSDISLINTEYVIDDVIDFVNLMADASLSSLSGNAGDKSVTLSGAQNAVVSMILSIMLKDVSALKTSSSAGLGPYSVSESIGSQPINVQRMVYGAIRQLKGSSFQRTI